MKRLVSLLVLVVFLIGCMSGIASANAVNAGYGEAKTAISALVSSLANVSDPEIRLNVYRHYLTYYVADDAHMDELITLVENNNLTSVDIIAALNAGGLSADEMLFLFQLIKSVPEADREAAVAQHFARGTYDIDAETAAALKDLYEELVAEDFRDTVFNEYTGLTYLDFYPFFEMFNGLFTITTENDKFVVNTIDATFANNLAQNIIAEGITEVNGVSVSEGKDVLQALISAIEDEATDAIVESIKTVLTGVNVYGSVIGDVDSDGDVDDLDSLRLAKYLAEYVLTPAITQTQLDAAAKINPNDGSTTPTAADQVKLLQHLAGWPSAVLGK